MPQRSPLGRPARIGVVVTDVYSAEDLDHDTPVLLDALRTRGAAAEPVVWHAPVDWDGFDLLLLRSPWDYPARLPEFLAWIDRVAARLVNPAPLVRWNLDKRYLSELAGEGVKVVPTTYASTGETASAALAALATEEARAVVKPARSAGARNTGLFEPTDPAALRLVETILAEGDVAMVQPEVAELSRGQELALYLVDGRLTHAIAKGALLAPGGGLIGGVYQEHPVVVTPTRAQEAFARETLAAVQEVTGCAVPLYARVDLVDSARYGTVLLEVELAEPALNLHLVPGVADVVADAVIDRLG